MKAFALILAVATLPWGLKAENLGETPIPVGAEVVSVTFDKDPKEQGMTFDRTNVVPATIQKEGQSADVWVANKSIEPTRGWSRSFRFNVTDPRFQKGGKPVIDLEIVYTMGKYGELDVKADTVDGAKVLRKVWDQNPDKWQVLHIPLNEAYLGSRVDPKDVVPKLDGFDLRLDSNNNINLRSVRLIGYDTDANIDWKRMLTIKQLSSVTPGGVYLFPKGPKQELDAQLQNFSHLDRPIYYKVSFTGYDDKVRFQNEGTVKVPPSGELPLGIIFDTSDWPLGPYDGKLDIYLDQADAQPLISRTFRIGVISSTLLEKARNGEFLYGLDAANSSIFSTHTPAAFAFYRQMGVDILRSPYDINQGQSLETLQAALADLAKENLQSAVMCDPPKDYDKSKWPAQLKEKTALLEAIAKNCAGKGPGKAHFFELGNEPDLPVFNPGSMSDFANCFYAMYDAVKQGAQEAGLSPGDTVVMNGGLSFAGSQGISRSRDFLQNLDLNKIDAIAYHGHGPGIEAERMAYERAHAAAAEFGKATKPFVETESGVSASDRLGMIDQARTAVEKMTYAQSQGEPLFMFFRLYMEGGSAIETGYGMTDHLIEPRPSVLSYRNMVERLRHFRFVKSLDFSSVMRRPGIDAFLFEEIDANKKPTGRKTMVAFSEKPAQFDLRLQLDQPGATVASPTLYDLFGNPTPLIAGRNIASVPLGLDPVFVSWASPGGADAVIVSPPIISIDNSQPILAGASTTVTMILNNPEEKPLDVDLVTDVQSRIPATVNPATQKVTLVAGQPMQATVAIQMQQPDQPLDLPVWWKLFPDVDYTQLSAEQLSAIPDSLPGKNGPEPGEYALAENNRLDFAKMFGGYRTKRPGIAYAVFDSPADITLDCGANSDWWMVWYLNGQKIYDTLEKGNLENNLSVHSFTLPLKKGRNVLAVAVLSGTFGWNFEFGGPKELGIAKTGNDDSDRLVVALKSGDKIIASQEVALTLQMPVPALESAVGKELPADWMSFEPMCALADEAVKNYWMKEPDANKWYKGKKDLSGLFWLRDDGKNLHLFAAITDDKLVQAASPADLAKNDSLRIVISDDAGKSLLDTTAGLVNNAAVMTGTTAGLTFTAGRKEDADSPVTYYHLTIPKAVVANKPFHLNLAVADNDAGFLKQTLQMGNVDDPVQGKHLVARP